MTVGDAEATGVGRAHAVESADIYAMLILVAGAGAYIVVWLWPPRPFRPSEPGPPLSDPDAVGVPPAVCGFLLRGCRQADEDFTATLLDLVDRGVVEVSPQPGDREDQLLTLHAGRLGAVWPHEDALLRLLFETAGEHEALTLRDFDRFARERPREYERGLDEFRRAFGEATMGLQGEPLGRFTIPVSFTIPVLMVWVSVYTVAWADTFVYLVTACALAALMFMHGGIMYRRITQTRKYQLRCAQLRRFLLGFVEGGAALTGAHPLWGRYLVYATALGIEGEMRAALRARRLAAADLAGVEWPWWQTTVAERDWRGFLLGGDGAGRPLRRRRRW